MAKEAHLGTKILHNVNKQLDSTVKRMAQSSFRLHQKSVYHRYDRITKKHARRFAIEKGNPFEALIGNATGTRPPNPNQALQHFIIHLFRYYYNLIITLQVIEDDALSRNVRETAIQVGVKQLYKNLSENQRLRLLTYFQTSTDIRTIYQLLHNYMRHQCLDDVNFWGFENREIHHNFNGLMFGFLDQLTLSLSCVIHVLSKKDKTIRQLLFKPVDFENHHVLAHQNIGLTRNFAKTERQKLANLASQGSMGAGRLSVIGTSSTVNNCGLY